MAKKMMFVTVRGKQREWHIPFRGDTKYLQEWRDDGLEVYVIENSVPAWIVDIGLLHPYLFLQDAFNFRWPFRSKGDRNA